ncbi:hypothetical protein niasHT_034220 [Heterodera trifolii]|uniref:Uncharacterized protein n=1 Tax=Heterodera trifolii TaxID=157864 RepID=A0ABD2J336_9BILA
MSNQSAAELADEYERGDGEAIKSNEDRRTEVEQENDSGQFVVSTPSKMEESEDSGGEVTPEKELNVNAGVTPAIIKLRQSRTEFKVYSPSDQLFSPCTRKIEKNRLAGTFSQPQVFRTRPPLLPPSHASTRFSTVGCSTVGSNRMRNDGTVAPACTPQRLALDEEGEDSDDDGAKTEQKQTQMEGAMQK